MLTFCKLSFKSLRSSETGFTKSAKVNFDFPSALSVLGNEVAPPFIVFRPEKVFNSAFIRDNSRQVNKNKHFTVIHHRMMVD